MTNLVNLCCLGKMTGLLASLCKSELTSLPSHLKIALSSLIPSSLTSCLKLVYCFNSLWTDISHSILAHFNSSAFNFSVRFSFCFAFALVCYTAVFSVVTQRSSPLTATENRTTFLSLCVCGLTNKPIMYKKFDNA